MDRILILSFYLAQVGVPLLAVVGLGCLIYCKGKYHRYLVRTAAVFLGALVLYFGGIILLGCFGMTWRNGPSLILCAILLVSGCVGIVLTLACVLPAEWRELAPVLRRIAKSVITLAAAAVILVAMWGGPIMLLFGLGNEERVVEYQGRTLLEVDDGFLDPHYSYYVYHGPLARGTERIYDGPTHIYGDFDSPSTEESQEAASLGKQEAVTAEDQEAIPDLDFFYQNPVTQAYQDIRTLDKSYDEWQAQADMCFIINAMVHNDSLYYENKEQYQNQEDTFIRVVQGSGESGIRIDDILYDSSTDKIYLVHDSTRDNLAVDKGITLNEFEGIAEYRHNRNLYWIAFNGAIDDIDFDGDEIFIITLIC